MIGKLVGAHIMNLGMKKMHLGRNFIYVETHNARLVANVMCITLGFWVFKLYRIM